MLNLIGPCWGFLFHPAEPIHTVFRIIGGLLKLLQDPPASSIAVQSDYFNNMNIYKRLGRRSLELVPTPAEVFSRCFSLGGPSSRSDRCGKDMHLQSLDLMMPILIRRGFAYTMDLE